MSIPDSGELWSQIWEHRASVYGFAHSHPGSGPPMPSDEDLTTFAAIESALGRRLHWWIASSDSLTIVHWNGPDPHYYASSDLIGADWTLDWLRELRERTKY